MKRLVLSLIVATLFGITSAQRTIYEQYIDKYKHTAVEQMHKYGIPASITLAQGLLESGAGTSMLAVSGNNHFGIKAGNTWTGPYLLKDDDLPQERFRKYNSASESYEDHSLFLTTRPRYASLFKLPPTDYRSWAYGLKKAGYATNPRYAESLIGLIETYNLQQYDNKHEKKGLLQDFKDFLHKIVPVDVPQTDLPIKRCNENYYLVARSGDTYASIAHAIGIKEQKLRKYNEVDSDMPLSVGDIVFLEKKKAHVYAQLRGKYHTIAAGESMHSIAQSYGVRLSALYKANKLPSGYFPRVGERLLLD
ncbi:glucosaminidase domain-containing protein [Alloprevotella tannerae]|uniref:glucosaminidase domain-containing protein n=1 Tax=Alloprevotella tannerae TaxID=76122 RepID=UPI0028E25DA1|nr:glucosaminidase domain-containing protein [Alloprevotella tannerae]